MTSEGAADAGGAPAEPRDRTAGRPRGPVFAAVSLALCLAAFLAELAPPVPQSDDAYISYRYARNLVDGEGLVFNPGERVEGYTNLSWVLAVAAALAVGVDAPLAGHVYGLASGLAALLATALYARALLPKAGWAVAGIAPWLVLASTPFARWTTSGLETPLFAAATTFALVAAARGRAGAAAGAAAFATATRPEGMLVAALVLAPGLLKRRPEWRAWRAALAYAGFLAALTAFRLAYYGSPLPNTFYAKVSGVPLFWGLVYLDRFLSSGAALLAPAAAFAAARLPRARPGALLVLGFAVYVVAVGGDALGLSRLLVPVVPALAALAAAGTALAWRASRPFGVVAAVSLGLSLIVSVAGPLPTSTSGLQEALRRPERARLLAGARNRSAFFERLAIRRAAVLERRHPGRPPLVAAVGIGAIGYYADARILDLLGLTDATIARTEPEGGGPRLPGHSRSNAPYVLSRAPDYVFLPSERGPGQPLPAVRELREHPAFARDYERDRELRGYRRRDAAVRAPTPP